MNHPPLLYSLGRVARETELHGDPRLDKLAQQRLSAADVDSLRIACQNTQWRGALFEAFSPIDAAAQKRIADRAMARLAAQSGRLSQAPEPAPRRGAVVAAFALCAAAAITLYFAIRSAPAPVAQNEPAAANALPDYQLEVLGSDAPNAVRSQANEPVGKAPAILGKGGSLTLVLRPEKAVSTSVSAVACTVREGRARPLPVTLERSEQGAFRAQGTRESMFGSEPVGEITVVVAVAPTGTVPTCEAVASLAGTTAHDANVRVLTQRVLLK